MTETTVHIGGRTVGDTSLEWGPVAAMPDPAVVTMVAWTPSATGARFPGWWPTASSTTHAIRTSRIEEVLSAVDLVLAATSEPDAEPRDEPNARELALGAVESLRRWLGLTDEQVAELAGIAPRSIPNWRNKRQQPYPATVRRLFEIHNLVASLVRRLGLHETGAWLAQPVDGVRRIDLLGGEHFNRVLSQAADLLFSQPPRRHLVEDHEEEEAPRPPRNPELFRGRARGARPRRST